VQREFQGLWLGRRRYDAVHELQERLHAERRAGAIGDTVLFVEHDPVVTFGRRVDTGHLLTSREALRDLGVDLAHTGRGGDVTLHAPGQLVCYPILDLSPDRRDVRAYVNDLVETMRRLAASYGVSGGAAPQGVGLWVDREAVERWPGHERAAMPQKLGAIGVRISRWVSMHGFAFNLTTHLDLYGLIVPCGLAGFGVTSIQALTGRAGSVHEAAERGFSILADVFDARILSFDDEIPKGVQVGARP
jgi:lipoyl(octanoyl) transferase